MTWKRYSVTGARVISFSRKSVTSAPKSVVPAMLAERVSEGLSNAQA